MHHTVEPATLQVVDPRRHEDRPGARSEHTQSGPGSFLGHNAPEPASWTKRDTCTEMGSAATDRQGSGSGRWVRVVESGRPEPG